MFHQLTQSMNLRKFRKMTEKFDSNANKHRVKHNDYTGYSAVIACVTEELTKRPWPADHKSVMLQLRDKHVKIYRNYLQNLCKKHQHADPEEYENDNVVIFTAVLEQAMHCKDMFKDEVESFADSDNADDNVIKVLKNIQLLPADFCLE